MQVILGQPHQLIVQFSDAPGHFPHDPERQRRILVDLLNDTSSRSLRMNSGEPDPVLVQAALSAVAYEHKPVGKRLR